ncbi:MAG: proteasome subunit beta [Candidatus Lokiarchaeota archaeon]|nr:proteasome subunit beta [Candidatus Lokiarchaeota archaeon]
MQIKDPSKILKTGTTTIGLIIKNGVILATESQATAGYYVATKRANKLFKLMNNMGITISGGVADCQNLVRLLQALLRLRELELEKDVPVSSAVALLSSLMFQRRYFPYYSMLVMGGVDEEGPQIYSMDFFGSILKEENFVGVGSGSVMAIGVLEADWKEDLTEEEGIELAKSAIESARRRDSASGGKLQLAVIDKEGFRWVEKI